VRAITRCSPGTKVLVLSASNDRTTVLEMLEAGVVGYLVKGASIASIVDSIERAAAGQGTLSGEVAADVIAELAGGLQERKRASEQHQRRTARIRRAIDEDDALEIVYQPIFGLADQSAIGVEALARFRGPSRRGPERWFA